MINFASHFTTFYHITSYFTTVKYMNIYMKKNEKYKIKI